MIDSDLNDAIDNILVYIDCDKMNDCREYLKEKMKEAQLR